MVTIQSQNFGVEIEMTGVSRGTAASVIANYFGVGGIHFAGGTYQTYEAKDSKGRVWKCIHDIICRFRHGFRGLVVRDIALAHGHPRVFHRTAASKNLCDQGNAGGRPIAAVFIFRHKLSP